MTLATDHDYRLLIGGEWVSATGGYEVVNPATEELVGIAPNASVSEAQDACAAARAAQKAWAAVPMEERCALLAKVADIIDARRDELVALTQAETGATMRVAKSMQVPQAAARFRYYAQPTEVLVPLPPAIMPATPLAPGGIVGAVEHRAPVGVVACLAAYNFPITNMAGKMAPALAMGNTVVVKPPVQDPLGTIRLCEAFEEAGFPPGVVNVVVGDTVATAEAITTSPDVDMISFTGSTAVGCRIAEVAGGQMKRLLLELGGKGAAIVFDDADVEMVLAQVSSTWTFHSGQICTSPTRLVVQRDLYDEVVGKLAAMAGHLKVGDPLERDTVLGPVITAAHRDRVEGHVASALAEGATAAAGGDRPERDRGFYVAPTLLVDATNQMAAAREEIFGPVIVALPFDDPDEAVATANDSPYGLYSYVFSGDTGRAMAVAQRLESGNVGINTLQRNHEAAFGGFKYSGVGRDGGQWGLHAYSEMQSIMWAG
ncbi:aldehyde dehydrogenase family protein [Iamia sp.]|uniref:aldehyde dehydrogenase family protein n=1 Tax=Iamia sp. TaxID=2722710 RepID=UPI002BF584DB|nr:aldehyde dehydrogenase family protein [Iamia sp.]HXH55868.1 aldehyde dehydrogenase family protein [Iamia sp.]